MKEPAIVTAMLPSPPPPHPADPCSGLTLLDSSKALPKSAAMPRSATDGSSSNDDDIGDAFSKEKNDGILRRALAWKLELEAVRDDLYWLQVQNCQSLDALCMAGAEMADA